MSKFSSFHPLRNEFRWIIVGIIWLVCLFLGIGGFQIYSAENGLNWSFGDIAYRTIQLPKLSAGDVNGKVNGFLEAARFLLPLVSVYAIIFGVFELLEKQLQWLKLATIRDHIVICGLGKKGSYLAKDQLRNGVKVVSIENDQNCREIKLVQKEGGLILNGDATKLEVLNSAKIIKAKHLVCFLGNDSLNLQVAMQAYQITQMRKVGNLDCTICITSKGLLDLIKVNELFSNNHRSFHLAVFNPYERAARSLLLGEGMIDLMAVEKNRHLMIIGWGSLGESLIIQAINSWKQINEGNLRITILDSSAHDQFLRLIERFPGIQQACEIIPIELDVSNNLKFVSEMTRLLSPVDIVYLCLSDPVLSLQVFLNLSRLKDFHHTQFRIRLDNNSGFSSAFKTNLFKNEYSNKVNIFDLFEISCKGNLVFSDTRTNIARGLYELYRTSKTNASDNRQDKLSWNNIPPDEKISNLNQADRIITLLTSVDRSCTYRQYSDEDVVELSEEEINTMAKLEHELWCNEKISGNWKYGDFRDNKQQTHPLLIPWDELSENEKEMNRVTIREIPLLLNKIGFHIDDSRISPD